MNTTQTAPTAHTVIIAGIAYIYDGADSGMPIFHNEKGDLFIGHQVPTKADTFTMWPLTIARRAKARGQFVWAA